MPRVWDKELLALVAKVESDVRNRFSYRFRTRPTFYPAVTMLVEDGYRLLMLETDGPDDDALWVALLSRQGRGPFGRFRRNRFVVVVCTT